MNYKIEDTYSVLCEPAIQYSRAIHRRIKELSLFSEEVVQTTDGDIRVVELFAGVGGFRVGLERASEHYKTVWNNQWEPSTKRQDASVIYCKRFGTLGHCNEDIASVPTSEIPDSDLLCGGFPCQDYSVATTLQRSSGIEGKKGVLWWQIYRILLEKGDKRPKYLMLENVDRLLNSPAKQRGRDFAIILSSLANLGYTVEWRVVNAADYGMPQRRRRTYIVAYQIDTKLQNQYLSESEKFDWVLSNGVMATAFPCQRKDKKMGIFSISMDIAEVSENFNKGKKESPFQNSGVMSNGEVFTLDTLSVYDGHYITLGEILEDEKDVPKEFFITEEDLSKWEYLKGHKLTKAQDLSTIIVRERWRSLTILIVLHALLSRVKVVLLPHGLSISYVLKMDAIAVSFLLN